MSATMSSPHPKVFISHASEDKPFVKQLATRLIKDGVDAWFDKWEIRLGDSLVQKVSAGIGECDVFLIVLSRTSVQKPWVRVELDAAFIEMIEEKTKLMPVRIDDCDVPVLLKPKLRYKFDPLGEFESQYREILHAIFDRSDKPALGTPPAYLVDPAPGYSPDETAIWDHFIKTVDELGPVHIPAMAIHQKLPHIPLDEIRDAVDVLERDGILALQRFGSGDFLAELSPSGWHDRAAAVLHHDVEHDERTTLASLDSDGDCDGEELARRTGIAPNRLMMAIEFLHAVGCVDRMLVTGHGLGSYGFVQCTVDGRRALRRS